ncbi:Uncharacterised protein [Candidatus Gugararchaeum adminiculabundum]|nr:Uncharacterised protein [Candidatus Gugararchaeum adminiculabundum]
MRCNFDFSASPAGYVGALFERAAHRANGIGDCPFSLVDHVLGRGADENCHALRVFAVFHKNHLLACDFLFLNYACEPELLLVQIIQRSGYACACCSCQFFHVALLHSSDCNDFLGAKIMLRHVIDSLLAEDDICTGLFDFLDHVLEHFFLLSEERLHLVRARDFNLGIDFRLLDFERGIDQGDFRLLHFLGHSGVDYFLVH